MATMSTLLFFFAALSGVLPAASFVSVATVSKASILDFVPSQLPNPLRLTPLLHPPRSWVSSRSIVHQSANDDGDAPQNDDDYDDDPLLDELRNVKQERFGVDLPPSKELAAAAEDSENSFLAAMLEETRKFRDIKEREGSSAAVKTFMGEIQVADEQELEEREEWGNNAGVDDDDGDGEREGGIDGGEEEEGGEGSGSGGSWE